MESCTFNEAKRLVRRLVNAKGFPDDESALTQKLLWAFVELGEAADAYKKGEDWNAISEELIDVIFYILDFIGLVDINFGTSNGMETIFDSTSLIFIMTYSFYKIILNYFL